MACFNKSNPATAEKVFRNLDTSVTYVGKETCKQCHADIYNTYIKTGMGQSFGLATKEKSAADFSGNPVVFDRFRNLYYHPYWSNDSMRILEFRLNKKDTIHKRIETVNYIIGSGQHTNSHLFSINGYLYQAPLTYYTQKGKWDLPPGFEDGNNTRFSRVIGMECMSCHNALPDFVDGSENKFTSIPDGISCERCHGPGSLHVKEKKEGKLVNIREETDYSIVNPSKLSWQLQIDVCQRCHLQGNAVLKPGKKFSDFRPGMHLDSVMDVYMPKYEGDNTSFIMASHAQRLQMSKCFINANPQIASNNSNLKLTCITCHNPHISVKVTGKEVYNKACQKCHSSAEKFCTEKKEKLQTENNNCVKCHMPKSGTEDIPHVTVHDHYIRKPEQKTKSNSEKIFAGISAINNKKPLTASKAEAYLNYFEKFDNKERRSIDSAAYYLSLNDQEPLELYIRLLFIQEDYRALVLMGQKLNPLRITDAWTAYRIGEGFFKTQNYQAAILWYGQSKDLAPFNVDFKFKYGVALYAGGQPEPALKTLRDVVFINPRHASAWSNLGSLLFNYGNGNVAEANECYDKALSLDPDLKSALLNKIDLYGFLNDNEKVNFYLRRLYALDPENPRLQPLYKLYKIK